MKIIKLFPRKNSKFHFGYLGLDINDYIFHSDSLFSCLLINNIKKNGEDSIEDFVRNFPKITSLFYGINKNDRDILFFPFYFDYKIPEKFNYDRKILKKIKMISLGAIKINENLKINKEKNLIYLEDEGNDINLFYDYIEEKVSIDRKTLVAEEGKLYSVSYIIPEKDVFFFFIADGKLNSEFENSIEMIKNFGIGGEINLGAGIIEKVEINDFDGFDNLKGDKYMNLSIVFPSKKDFEKLVSYKLIERKGWVYLSSKRKSNIIGIGEGSIFNQNVEGEIREEIIDNKKIYRYGKAFTIPVVLKDDG